jgi:ribonuclease VapC
VTSPVTIFEVVAAFMTRKRDTLPRAQERLNRFLAAGGIRTIAITPEIGALALSAFDKYGKGRGHKAQLNMGDCFAYACAKSLGVPLLYKGDDFAKTDLA